MGLIISGKFFQIAQIRNFIQGEHEPYVDGSRSGYGYSGMVDDAGGGAAVLMLSDAIIPGKKHQETKDAREKFLFELKKAVPDLDIKYG